MKSFPGLGLSALQLLQIGLAPQIPLSGFHGQRGTRLDAIHKRIAAGSRSDDPSYRKPILVGQARKDKRSADKRAREIAAQVQTAVKRRRSKVSAAA